MKLTQSPARSAGPGPAAEAEWVAGRLEVLERRLAQVEQAPAAVPAPAAAAPPLAPPAFDQKVLEAVVNALDARLREHAGQVERRLAELEAKITLDLQDLHQQDHSIANGLQNTVNQLQQQFAARVDAVGKSAEQSRQELHREILAVHREAAEAVEAIERRARGAVNELAAPIEERMREELRQGLDRAAGFVASASEAMERRATAAVNELVGPIEERMREELWEGMDRAAGIFASASEAVVEEKLAPIHRRVAENDRVIVELLQGIGNVCREAAGRMGGAADEIRPEPPADAPPSGEAPPVEAPPPPEPAAAPLVQAGALPNGSNSYQIPAFAQVEPPSRLWRIPLASSLAALGGFASTHLPMR